MTQTSFRLSRIGIAGAIVLGGLSLSACATKGYVDEQISAVNGRVSAVDAKATDALQRADAANAAAQAAAADARNANQRLDQLTPRVDAMEQRAANRSPRN
jgi:outer membrane murein-binding lipoprotein Lpp